MTGNADWRNEFRELRLDGGRSIAADVPDRSRRGVYAYEFTDGTWYVGKASDVCARHVQHLHEYRHHDPPLVMARMLHMPLPGSSDAELDRAESEAIAAFEREGRDLRNIMKAGRPGGSAAMVIEAAGGFGVEMPWSRSAIAHAVNAPPPEGEAPRGMERRYRRLAGEPFYTELVSLLARYVDQTVPRPDLLAGRLWSVTAFPPPRGGSAVAACLSVGNIEGLTVLLDGDGPYGFLNMKCDGSGTPLARAWTAHRLGCRRATYRSADGVLSVGFDSLFSLSRLLGDRAALDWCYRLNAEMLRRGSCMYAGRCNVPLAADILHAVMRFRERASG